MIFVGHDPTTQNRACIIHNSSKIVQTQDMNSLLRLQK